MNTLPAGCVYCVRAPAGLVRDKKLGYSAQLTPGKVYVIKTEPSPHRFVIQCDDKTFAHMYWRDSITLHHLPEGSRNWERLIQLPTGETVPATSWEVPR